MSFGCIVLVWKGRKWLWINLLWRNRSCMVITHALLILLEEIHPSIRLSIHPSVCQSIHPLIQMNAEVHLWQRAHFWPEHVFRCPSYWGRTLITTWYFLWHHPQANLYIPDTLRSKNICILSTSQPHRAAGVAEDLWSRFTVFLSVFSVETDQSHSWSVHPSGRPQILRGGWNWLRGAGFGGGRIWQRRGTGGPSTHTQ